MPTFRTAPSRDLGSAIRRAVESTNLGDGVNVQADMAAAKTARDIGLAEKARAEAEAIRNAETARNDPKVATEYAGNAAGMTNPDATRLSNHLRGALEQPTSNDDLDASMRGQEAQPFVTGAPNVSEGQRRGFQTALASLIANRVATGHTNAEQLARAGADLNKTALQNEATDATTVPEQNRLLAAMAGKVREPFKTNAQGTVLNEETGALNEGTQLAQAVRSLTGAHAGSYAAAGRASDALAEQRALETRTGVRIGAPVLVNDPEAGTIYTAPSAAVGRAPAAKPGSAAAKPPAGYRFTADGSSLEVIPGGPKDVKPEPGLTPDAIEMLAKEGLKDKSALANVGRGVQGARDLRTILNRMADVAANDGGPGMAARRQEFRADANSLNKLTMSYDAITAFEKTAVRNGDALVQLGKKIDVTGVPIIEKWIRAGRQATGDADVAEFHAQMMLYRAEAARILVNPNLTGQLTDSARHEVEEFLKGNASAPQIERVVGRLKTDFDNRKHTLEEQMDEARKRMAGGARSSKPAPATAAPIAAPAAAVNGKGWKLMKDAKGNQAYVSPDGKEFEEAK